MNAVLHIVEREAPADHGMSEGVTRIRPLPGVGGFDETIVVPTRDGTAAPIYLQEFSSGRWFEICHLPCRIGRDSRCELTLAYSGVSRHHATISRNDGETVLTNLASRNGLWVNGRRRDHAVLASADEISLGDVHLRVFLERPWGIAGTDLHTSEASRALGAAHNAISPPDAVMPVVAAVTTAFLAAVGLMLYLSTDPQEPRRGAPAIPPNAEVTVRQSVDGSVHYANPVPMPATNAADMAPQRRAYVQALALVDAHMRDPEPTGSRGRALLRSDAVPAPVDAALAAPGATAPILAVANPLRPVNQPVITYWPETEQ